MSSDSSSTDSDSEVDETVNQSVQAVFSAMKQSLGHSSQTKPKKSTTTQNMSPITAKHRLIYQTFDDLSSDSDDSDSKEKPHDNVNIYIDRTGGAESKQQTLEKSKKAERKEKALKEKKSNELSSSLQSDLKMEDIYVNVDPYNNPTTKTNISNFIRKEKEPEIMKKCVITDDFEKQDSIATTNVSVRQGKKERKSEREKTKGDKWFNMPATELTDERKHDIAVLKMRKVLDPKRFYKANDVKAAPKYFQFGTVVEDPSDFYSSRIPKKQRKATIVEELLADSDFRQYNKRKYVEVQDAKRQGKGPYQHMKRLKKKGKR